MTKYVFQPKIQKIYINILDIIDLKSRNSTHSVFLSSEYPVTEYLISYSSKINVSLYRRPQVSLICQVIKANWYYVAITSLIGTVSYNNHYSF